MPKSVPCLFVDKVKLVLVSVVFISSVYVQRVPNKSYSLTLQVLGEKERDIYLLVPQTKMPCIVTSRRFCFVGGLDIKKAESYY